ncbi:ABC transporter ATP-binding protein [Pseudarthrobacter sulfonivorans]|uniref:ABC transporter ATP-binding protein n=1 Tax=Pseudarthrobacter sulfonivorans TaxID=121292 RepID=A0A0U3Q024_9MICC|nr:ABC transporter ATP-binding protein [Pseudarthrobacter sulfonivorans]ALV39966.1 ABC transporter ATP-binding protein [Pseudarthrobacter sulfonivorans]
MTDTRRDEELLAVRDLVVNYGPIRAVSGVSIGVHRGETVVLCGANGAGKSTTIKAIMGSVPASSGSVHLDGQPITTVSAALRARRGIRLSPEGRQVFATMTVEENIRIGAHQLKATDRNTRVEELFDTFPLLAERRRSRAGDLSGGQQQIVAMGRAMASRPRLLLLDEPFLGLAPIWIASVSDAIRTVQAAGTALLISEQMARPALELADRGYVLKHGSIARRGTADEVRSMALAEEYV